MARTLVELPFDLNLWQAQNIWYEVLRSSRSSLNALTPEDREKWEKRFNDLGNCLSIDTVAMTAPEPVAAGD
jgi:hypothetical protein